MTRQAISAHVVSRPALIAALCAFQVVTVAAQSAMPSAAVEPSATHRAAIEAAFTRADTNADGKLSRDEAARMPAIAAMFDELDTNKDGFLSLEEFAVGAARMPR
jgi:EF hand